MHAVSSTSWHWRVALRDIPQMTSTAPHAIKATVPCLGKRCDLAVWALHGDARIAEMSLPQWTLLLRHARRADVLARIAFKLHATGLIDAVPAAPRAHLDAAMLFCRAQHDDVLRELRYIAQALSPLLGKRVLLKGAAYVLADSPAAMGRLFTDIDILVPKAELAEAESQLTIHGWTSTHQTPYDQRYYREWMHELPPMQNLRRQTTLDVHHNILPLTARLRPPADKLLAGAQPAAGGFHVLSPVDMVLHSATHLLHNEELSHGLRDLSDIDLLLRHFSEQQADFWPALIERGRQMDLARPLYYALRSVVRLLGTPVPQETLHASAHAAPGPLLGPLMDALWRRALGSQHESVAPAFTPAALFVLYVRAHWLRMPPLMLMRHLSIKALRRAQDEDKTVPV